MKKYIALVVLSLGLFTACDMVTGEGEGTGNAVYMGNSTSNGVISVVVTNEGASAVVTPRLANLADKPVEVTVELDEEMLAAYNAEAGLSMEALAAEDFVFVTKDSEDAKKTKETHGKAVVTIEPGKYNASVEVRIPKLDETKYPPFKRLAVPVSVTAASQYKILSSPRSTLIRLNREIITSVGQFRRGGSIALVPNAEIRKDPMFNWTMQVSMYYRNLPNRDGNWTVMSIQSGAGNFYTRIERQRGIQVKNGRDGEETFTQKSLPNNRWLHITFVHRDASTVSVYVNGELQKTFPTSPIAFSDDPKCCLYIGNTQYSGVYLREARMWNRALTEGEIIDKEYLPLDPSAESGLIMYMPFTRVADDKMEELTGNWEFSDFRTLGIWDENPPAMQYVDNVKFPSEDLVIIEPENSEEEIG